jgi:hypothetical protein
MLNNVRNVINGLLSNVRYVFDSALARVREGGSSDISAQEAVSDTISDIIPIAVGATQANVEEGFSNGGLHDNKFPAPSQGVVPLLGSFFFQYVLCQSRTAACFGQVDHHITQILIAPNRPNDKGETDNIRLGFHDANSDDDYFFSVAHRILNEPSIRMFDTGLVLDFGSTTRVLQTPTPVSDFVFVLVGFQLAFRPVDHHINEVGILEENGVLTVTFADQNFDDAFQFRIQYAYVPRNMFSTLGQFSRKKQRSFDRVPIEPGNSVIRGFRFDFKPYFTSGQDHHIKQIGVVTSSGRVDGAYADRNDDDGFDWDFRYGILK